VNDPIGRVLRLLGDAGQQRALAGELWPWALLAGTVFVLRRQRRATPPQTIFLERGAAVLLSAGPAEPED
jgi:hypothetical protein